MREIRYRLACSSVALLKYLR